MRYCLAPHCGTLIEGRAAYCSAHAPQVVPWRKKVEASGWERSRIRRRVLRRAGYVCQIPGCREPATEVDHIVSRARGGTDDLSNLRGLCPDHHAAKSEAERLAGLRKELI